ncbi:MAG: hypothetical protein WC852_02015 [Candidatus Nanoarchaeia archaeon]|jgi:hypothetical protein
MTDMQDLFAPKKIKAKKGLFEIVQAVATQLGDYSYFLPKGLQLSYYPGTGFSKNDVGVDRKYIFQSKGLKAAVEFSCKVDDDRKYYAPASAIVEVNGKEVFHELKCLGRNIDFWLKPVVQAYEPGSWEKQIWNFYEQAIHMKAAREARRDVLRQKIKAAGIRRSASIW